MSDHDKEFAASVEAMISERFHAAIAPSKSLDKLNPQMLDILKEAFREGFRCGWVDAEKYRRGEITL